MHEAHHLSFFCACASCFSLLYVGCWCWPPLAMGHHLHLMHIYCRHVQTLLTLIVLHEDEHIYFFTILRNTLFFILLRKIC